MKKIILVIPDFNYGYIDGRTFTNVHCESERDEMPFVDFCGELICKSWHEH